ncbi:hypothetical protein [Noviherbaspirillum sp.]|uniref:hypothetical protein n=1 Tax=Noviherbaspirillum sp. TaxID=1926288 RepID=UPI002FE26E66
MTDDELYNDLLNRAKQDVELVARTAIAHLVRVMAERDSLQKENAQLVANHAALRPAKRGRPPVKKAGLKAGFAMYVPVKLRRKKQTAGAPQKYAFPQPTKVHALSAAQRVEMLRKLGIQHTNRDAAEIELAMHGIDENTADHAVMVRELQRRIGEALRKNR